MNSTTTTTTTTLVPPINFAQILPGIYRSGHPHQQNFAFMETLGLKSIMYLSKDDYRKHTSTWAKENELNIFHHRIESTKEPFTSPSLPLTLLALEQLLDTRNLPLLLHDNKGRLLPSLLVALLRLLNHWSFSATLEEYRMFLPDEKVWAVGLSGKPEKGRERVGDLEFIDRFPLGEVKVDLRFKPDWLD